MSPPEQLTVELRPDRHRLMLVLRGELDHATADEVRRAVDGALSDGWAEVTVDLRALSFMDAGGLNLLFGLRDHGPDGAVTMVDGVGEAARVLGLLPGEPPLPKADVRPTAAAPAD